MIDWKRYFTKTIIDRGQAYYKRGRVGNLKKVKDKYCAIVDGSFPYAVKIWKKANKQLGMSCDCMHAMDGNYCKHMAAVCMKMEEELGTDVWSQMGLQTPKNPDEPVKLFQKKNVTGAKEYTCFDLSEITHNIKIMNSQAKAARQLIENNMVELQTVSVGCMEEYNGDSVPVGEVKAYYNNRTSQIYMQFTSHDMLEAICSAQSCNHFYSSSYYNYSSILCKHQIAVLLLLEKYIEEYNPGDTTDARALDLIEMYQKKRRGQALAKAEAEVRDLQIEPKIERIGNGLTVSFRTGTKKLYIIKNIEEFVENVENKLTQTFGSTSEINYGVHKVSAEAEPYYEFMRKVVRGEQLRMEASGVYNGDTYIGNKIQLYGSRLDDMFELLLQKSGNIPFHDKREDVKYDNLFVEEQTPQVELILKNDYENSIFRGIEVSGTLPECIKGERNLYYLEKEHLYRIDKENESVLLPLMDASVNGKIKFHVGRKSLADFYYYTLPMLAESVSIVDKTKDVLVFTL